MPKSENEPIVLPELDSPPKSGVWADGEQLLNALAETDYRSGAEPDDVDQVDGVVVAS